MEVERPYFHRGPYEYDNAGESTYEFQWTVSDYFNAVIQAGCSIVESDEFEQGRDNWEAAPVDNLPKYLTIVARKNDG